MLVNTFGSIDRSSAPAIKDREDGGGNDHTMARKSVSRSAPFLKAILQRHGNDFAPSASSPAAGRSRQGKVDVLREPGDTVTREPTAEQDDSDAIRDAGVFRAGARAARRSIGHSGETSSST